MQESTPDSRNNVTDPGDRRRQVTRDAAYANTLDRMVSEIGVSEHRPAEFLAAWKAGITLMGDAYFCVESNTVSDAVDKFQLRPNFQYIEDMLPVLSSGQRRFLIGMCQFHSDSEIGTLCQEFGIDVPSLADLALLDDAYRSVLIRLLDSYTGW